MIRWSLIPAALLLSATLAGAELPVISVDAKDAAAVPLRKFVFGHNIESGDARGLFSAPGGPVSEQIVNGQGFWDPEKQAFFPGPVAQLARLRPTMLRYPGGCIVHNFDWRKLSGPRSEREKDHNFGVDEFLQLCEAVGAEPLMMITDFALPLGELPEHAADFVEYLNAPATPEHPQAMKRARAGREKPYGVKYFELGNESDHGNHRVIPTRSYTPEQYVEYFKSVTAAMKRVDPSIKVAPLTAPGQPPESEWNTAVYRNLAPISDFLIIHYYVAPLWRYQDAKEGAAVAMASADQLGYKLGEFRAAILKHGGKALPLAITEYNVACGREDNVLQRRFSALAGLCNADLVRLFLEPAADVEIANYWQIARGYFGAFSMRGDQVVRRAPLAFFEVWADHQGDTFLPVSVSGSPTADFGLAGAGLRYATGDRFAEPEFRSGVLPAFDPAAFRPYAPVYTFRATAPDAFTVDIAGAKKSAYINMGTVRRERSDDAIYRIRFEAKYTPAPGNAADGELGLGLCDSRGWEKAPLAIAVPGIELAADWQKFEGEMPVWHDTAGVTVVLRSEPLRRTNAAGGLPFVPTGQEPDCVFHGKLEVRGLKLETGTPGYVPAVGTLTAHASLADGGKVLNLVVFNKSVENPERVRVRLAGFAPVSAAGQQLAVTEPYSTRYESPRRFALDAPAAEFEYDFPPLSMTAFRFERQ